MSRSPAGSLALAAVLAGSAPISAAPLVPIYEIQGAGHLSPFAGEQVRTRGYVTYLARDGFYLQDQEGDGSEATSDAIFVFTGDKPAVTLEAWVELEGDVVEFIPGGAATRNLSTTRIENPTILPSIIDPPAWQGRSVVIGAGGRVPPGTVVDDDGMAIFDPENDGLDFFETMEGMLVTLPAPQVVCPSNAKAEMSVVVDRGLNASGMSKRGTLNLSPSDYNPERIQIQETQLRLKPGPAAGALDVGDQLEDVTGVLDYDGMYEVLTPQAVVMTSPGGLTPATTALAPYAERLRVASYNVDQLDHHLEDALLTDQTDGDPTDDVDDDAGNGRFATIAHHIVFNLQSPDIIALQEVQDDDGAEISTVTSAGQTLQTLVDAIVAAGGPLYRFLDSPGVVAAAIDDSGTPEFLDDDTVLNPNGGQAGGNMRNAYLYHPERVSPAAGSPVAVTDPDPADGDVFAGCPRPLLAAFLFQGKLVTLINVHFSARLGGSSVFGSLQPSTQLMENPLVNGGVHQRAEQAALVREVVDNLVSRGPAENVVVLGDFNDSEFLSPTLSFAGLLTNLTETLENSERYSIIAQGNSEALDHIFVSGGPMGHSPRYEIVHLNCEFADTETRASDHDPVLASLALANPLPFGVRTINGYGNNPSNPAWGQAGQPYLRTTAAGFSDLLNYPRGSRSAENPDPLNITQSDLPGARLISNLLCQHPTGVESGARLSSWTWQWGQFIDHDFGLSGAPGPQDPRESFPIAVPAGDAEFDPFGTGTQIIPFTRSGVFPGSGERSPRQTPNNITSFLDGSVVYGSDDLRAANLRSFTGGKLATQEGPDGELLPFNLYGRANANDVGAPAEALFLGGDVRANEHCALTAAHTLFVREHNRLANELAARDFSGRDPSDPLVDAEIYHRARKFVSAYIQAITYEEFLPAVLGAQALPAYTGYRQQGDASLSQEFSNAAYRVGHSMITPELLRLDRNGNPLPAGHLALRHAFFNPSEVTAIGIDPYLRGLATQVQQEIDRFVIEDVRSFLFGPPGSGGLDLAALNIQRGRDHGIPSLNDTRELLGLSRYPNYEEINSAPDTVSGFQAAYLPDNVEAVDLWIGGISEAHKPGSQLGETFHTIWVRQFTNLRDGDRFWYENDPFFTPEEVSAIRATSLADIIRRNSDAQVQDNVFRVPLPRLQITHFHFARATDTVTLTWRSAGGETFVIQASDDFGRTQSFSNVITTTGTPGTTSVSFTDPGASGKPNRAYRVVTP